jgi:hypothetical protein
MAVIQSEAMYLLQGPNLGFTELGHRLYIEHSRYTSSVLTLLVPILLREEPGLFKADRWLSFFFIQSLAIRDEAVVWRVPQVFG